MTTVVLEHLQHANSAGPDLTIDANGFIGVGTVSPVRPLSVVATGNTTSVFERTDGVYVLEMKGSGTTSPAAFGMSGNDLVALVNNSEKLRVDSNGALLLGTTTRNVYYNSSTQYAATAVIKTNISNDVADLVITNGTNNFGSTIDFARTNAAGNDVRYALMGGIATSNATGTETGYLTFRTKDSADNNIVERMRIDSAGRVTMPYQPGFRAFQNADYTHPSGNINLSSVYGSAGLWTKDFDNQNNFSTSTGLFTAPVTGMYSFSAGLNGSSNTSNITYFSCEFLVNGSRKSIHWFGNIKSGSSSYAAANNASTFKLAAGDTVAIHSEINATQVLLGGSSGAYSFFSGHLVG